MCKETLVNPWLQTIITVIGTLIASSGFWAYVQYKDTGRKQNNQLLMGLAYDKIISMGLGFIERGWITRDEYEDYRRYLYEPYKKLGGNGVTERIAAEVSNLPIRSRAKYAELLTEAKIRSGSGVEHPDDLVE